MGWEEKGNEEGRRERRRNEAERREGEWLLAHCCLPCRASVVAGIRQVLGRSAVCVAAVAVAA